MKIGQIAEVLGNFGAATRIQGLQNWIRPKDDLIQFDRPCIKIVYPIIWKWHMHVAYFCVYYILGETIQIYKFGQFEKRIMSLFSLQNQNLI